MEVIKTTRLQPNGDLSTEFHVTDFSDRNGREVESNVLHRINFNEVGLKALEHISNSIHRILLEESVEKQRDAIVGSQNYGLYFLIQQFLSHYISNSFPKMDELVWWLSVMISNETHAESTERYLNRKFYHLPKERYDAMSLRALLNDLPDISCNGYHDHQTKMYSEKISAWCNRDGDPWLTIPFEKIRVLANLGLEIREKIIKNTGFQWNTILDVLSEMQVVQVEYLGVPVYLTSRATSEIRTLFFMLDCPLPPVIVYTEHSVEMQIVRSSNQINETANVERHAA
ncbi:MAG: hypothetical protein N2450_06270 [bacterium]|nr:hypothetical protein [bacterium]